MDEDDSQDELINRSSSHSKGKRAAIWTISDDSDDLEEDSEEGDSDSGDDEEEHNANGEDDEEEEEEDSDEDEYNDEEKDAKSGKGTSGGSSADFAELSSDEDREKCPICLNSFSSQPVATPQNCEHYFCFDCILEWAKNANSCPVDRIVFDNIYLRKSYGGKVKKIVTVQKPVKAGQEETVDLDLEQTNCEVCGSSDREDRLLLCDGCDAGYHMECLTPPLDAVPVEEWFCPECEANNRQSRGSAEELSDTERMFSTPRPATSRSRTHTVGPTRAIARTQQSERVRANVNRHRITQARTSQLAPTYLMQSTWLDETINAVVAGLNTAVYVRDITPRTPSSQRRKTGKHRKVRRKKASAKGKNGQAESTGVRRRKRRVRKSKSRKKVIEKKVVTPRGRIARNLGIVKDKKSSSLPTVYRPAENTLSSMRADIGAASLSIYSDPFELDPFVDHEEAEEQVQVTSLLEAKRRGISRSALRSHQPVARPVTAGLSRRGVDVQHSRGVVEAAPVPDLLGSILSGQSILLMDSSDVVISRDGSLKASKPMMPSTPIPSSRNTSSSSDTSALNSPGCSYNFGENSASLHHNGNPSGSSPTSVNGLLTPRSSQSPSFTPPSVNHNQPRPHSDLTSGANPSLLPPRPNRPVPTNGVRALRETPSSSVHPIHVSNFKDKGTTLSQSQPKKVPVKPMWVDVSVLPRIPKIKRENSSVTNDGAGGIFDSSRGSSNSTGASNGPGLPKSGMNSLSGDKGRQHSVDKQKGHSDGHKNRPERASSSSAFSNSFASSSSTTPASQARHASFSSSSAISFRINSSGNSWHARRLSITSSSPAGSNVKEQWSEKEEEAKRKQMHKDKKTLLASCTAVTKEQDNIYDPFNPTLSDSSSSSDEAEPTSLILSPQFGTNRGKLSTLGSSKGSVLRGQDVVQPKTESEEMEVSQQKPGSWQLTLTPEMIFPADCIKVEKESDLAEVKPEKQMVFLDAIIKKEPSSDESESSDDRVVSESEIKSRSPDTISPVCQHVEHIKAEKNTQEDSGLRAKTSSRSLLNYRNDSSASCSSTISKKQMEETKSDSPTCSSTPLGDAPHRKQTSKTSKDQLSSSSETDRGRREEHHASNKESKKKERDKGREKDRSSRRSRSRERRRAPSTSDSSQPSSPDRAYRKKRRSRSRSKDKTRRRSRSCSSSDSRERSGMKRHKGKSKERNERTERSRASKDRRHGRSRSKSRSKSRSRSRSRSKDCKRRLSRSRSRSRSRERRKDCVRQHAAVSYRDKVDSRSKDGRQRTKTSSREGRKEEGSTRSTDKTSASHVLSSRGTHLLQERKREKEITQRHLDKNKCAEVKKQELPSCSLVSQVKNEDKNFERGESQAKEALIELKNKKEIKKEKSQPVDIFEDCPTGKEIKSEEKNIPSLAEPKSEDEVMEDQNKTESCKTTIIKSETSPTQECPSPPLSSPPTLMIEDPLHDSACQSQPSSLESGKQQNSAGATLPIKPEPSESDDDFNVDVMLDSLDHVKSEDTEGSGAGAEEEKEAVEEKDEGEQISAAVGSKFKTQVKRVTWNIQEPEGPQPEKSPSKLALYKLKLKQEGSRKPSLPAQPSTQGAVYDPSKKSAAGLQTNSSSGELSTTEQREAEDGDLSRKDKYLKKLHMQERAVEEVKLAIKPFYQRRDINKDEYKEILRKAVQKVCHSKSGEINPVKVGNLIKAYVEKYKHARKHKKGEDSAKAPEDQSEPMKISDSP